VKDCGRAIALFMLAERLNHGTYNISTGRLVRNSEVVAAEGRNSVGPPDYYLDTTRLRADTGFRPGERHRAGGTGLRRLAEAE
jgi:UDP-glucose 4-epimerase